MKHSILYNDFEKLIEQIQDIPSINYEKIKQNIENHNILPALQGIIRLKLKLKMQCEYAETIEQNLRRILDKDTHKGDIYED